MNETETLPEHFSDESIVDQSSAMIHVAPTKITNGFSLTVASPDGSQTEIVLTYGELKAALADLEADRTTNPALYTSES